MRLARFIGNFQGLWAVRVTNSNLRIREGISKLWGGFTPDFPKFLALPAAKLYVWYEEALEVQGWYETLLSPCLVWLGSQFA